MINKILKELKTSSQTPTVAVKSDYTFLPIFQNSKVERVKKLEKTAIFSNLFQLKRESAKLMLLQVWVLFVRYIIPIFVLILLTTIEQKGLSDVYFYANAAAIVLCLYLFFRLDTIKNFTLKVTILIFVTFAFSSFFNLSVGILSVDKFMYHFAYSVTFFMILFFIIKDIFIDATFSKVWYFERNFYKQSSPNFSKLKKTLIVFFTISALLTSATMAGMGVLLTSKKIEIAQKLAKE